MERVFKVKKERKGGIKDLRQTNKQEKRMSKEYLIYIYEYQKETKERDKKLLKTKIQTTLK